MSIDISAFIEPKSDQLNADDLIAGPRTITITEVSGSGDAQQPCNVRFEGDGGKPWRPCKTTMRIMAMVWNTTHAQNFVGKSLTLYRDPEVMFGGVKVGGIRISHMSGLSAPRTVVVTESKSKRSQVRIQPLKEVSSTPAKQPDERRDEAPAPPPPPENKAAHQEAARAAARLGAESLRRWYSGASNEGKAAAKEIADELAYLRDEAERNIEDDPFGLPPHPGGAERDRRMMEGKR